MARVFPNLILSAILLAIPVVAQLSSPLPSSTGIDVLLYYAFDFALTLLGLAFFLALNVVISIKARSSVWLAIPQAAGFTLAWFIGSFLVVAQLHISLGGQL